VDEQPHDLLTLLRGEPGVQPLANLGQEVEGFRRGRLLARREGGEAVFEGVALANYPIELGVELLVAEAAADVEGDGLLALAFEGVERPAECDRLGLHDRALRRALGLSVEIVEDIARAAQPPLDVGPDGRLDGIGPDRLAPAAAGQGTAFDELAVAAVPADLAAALGTAVRQTAYAASNDALEEVPPPGVLGVRPVRGERRLGGVPDSR
jgi:hypothetical protein